MAAFPLETVASSEMMAGSRLFPRADWESSAALNSIFDALRATVSAGFPLACIQHEGRAAGRQSPILSQPRFPRDLDACHHVYQLEKHYFKCRH